MGCRNLRGLPFQKSEPHLYKAQPGPITPRPEGTSEIMSTSRIAHASVLELISLCGSAEPTRKHHRNQQPLVDGHLLRCCPELTHPGCVKRGVTLGGGASRGCTFRALSVYQNQHQESTHTMCIRGVRQDDSVHQGCASWGCIKTILGASRGCIKTCLVHQEGASRRMCGIKRVHQDGWVH